MNKIIGIHIVDSLFFYCFIDLLFIRIQSIFIFITWCTNYA